MLAAPSMEAHGRSVPLLPTTQQQRLVYRAVAVGKSKGKGLSFCALRWRSFWASRSLASSQRGRGMPGS